MKMANIPSGAAVVAAFGASMTNMAQASVGHRHRPDNPAAALAASVTDDNIA